MSISPNVDLFLRFNFDNNGRPEDAENISDIKNMVAPVNHYSSFPPELHRIRTPLNRHGTGKHTLILMDFTNVIQ